MSQQKKINLKFVCRVCILALVLLPFKVSHAKDSLTTNDPATYVFEIAKTNHNLFGLIATTANENDQNFLNALIQKTPKQLLPKVQLKENKLLVEGLSHPIEMLPQQDGSIVYQFNGKKWTPDPQASFARNIIVMGKTFFYQQKTTARAPTALIMNFAYAEEKKYFFAEKLDPETNEIWNELDEESKKQSEMLIDFQDKAGRLISGAAVIGGGLLIARVPSPWTKAIGYGGAAVGLYMFTSSAKADEVPGVREFICNGKQGPLEVRGLKNNGQSVLLRVLFDKNTKEPTTFIALDNGAEIYRQNINVVNNEWTWAHSPKIKQTNIPRDQASTLAMLQGIQNKCVNSPEKIQALNNKITSMGGRTYGADSQKGSTQKKSQ